MAPLDPGLTVPVDGAVAHRFDGAPQVDVMISIFFHVMILLLLINPLYSDVLRTGTEVLRETA